MNASEATNGTDLYRTQLNLVRYSAGANDQLVYCPLTKMALMLPAMKARILDRCNAFDTLDKHAARLCNELGFGPLHLDATRAILSELAEAGLLVSRGTLSNLFMNPPNQDLVPKISSIGIPTRDRPDSLERCLRSYAECSRLYDRPIKFLIADQSSNEEYQQVNLEVLGRLQKELAIEISYAGIDEKSEFVSRLAKQSGVSCDIISFALLNDENCPVATGANRNALLLSTLDQLTLQVDDDSICRLAPCPELRNGLAFVSKREPMQVWFPGEAQIKALANDFKSENFFALHEQLLGRSVVNCLSDLGNGDPNLDTMNAGFFLKYDCNSARVWMTALGVAGDSGVGTSHFYLNLGGNERERLVRQEDDYRFSMVRDQVIRTVPRATISDAAFCGGLNIGLDNRQLLPPFMPVQRSQDCVFSALIHACSGSGYTGFLPWMLLHDRCTASEFTPETMRKSVARRRAGDIIEILVKELTPKPKPDDPSKMIVALGKAFQLWGTAPLAEFEHLLQRVLLEAICLQIFLLEGQLVTYGEKPSYWANDVKLCLSMLRDGVTDKRLIIPHDLESAFGAQQAPIMMQRLVRRFGELLQVWPELRSATKELSGQDLRFFRKV